MYKKPTLTPRTPYEAARDRMNAATRGRYGLSRLNDGSDEYKRLCAAYDRYIASCARTLGALAEEEVDNH